MVNVRTVWISLVNRWNFNDCDMLYGLGLGTGVFYVRRGWWTCVTMGLIIIGPFFGWLAGLDDCFFYIFYDYSIYYYNLLEYEHIILIIALWDVRLSRSTMTKPQAYSATPNKS